MSINVLKTEVNLINKAMAELDDQRESALNALAALCPVKVGQKFTINSHSYANQVMEVMSISAIKDNIYPGNPFRWVIRGYVLKADGAPSKLVGESIIPVK